MACQKCGQPNRGGRYCKQCARDEHRDNRRDEYTHASLRDSEQPDEDSHAARNAWMLRQADQERDGGGDDD